MKKAFSLIELMIVIAIISFLAIITIPTYQYYIEKGYDTTAKASLQYFALAVKSYSIFEKKYPSTKQLDHLIFYGYVPDTNIILTGYCVSQNKTNSDATFEVLASHVSSSNVWVYDSSLGGVYKVNPNTGAIIK